MTNYMREIRKIVDEELNAFIWRNLARDKKFRMCLQCKRIFVASSRVNHFCSRKCYSKMHRLPGFVRRLINQRD